jgi:RNA polymerase sigma factor (sigma-70 family)
MRDSPGDRVLVEAGTADPLLRALAADLDEGFAELVRAYQDIVYSVALRVSERGQDAEDLSAEAFLRAYGALRTYDTERILQLRPRPWLLTIVLNVWRNNVRGSSRAPRQAPLDDVVELPSAGPSVEELVEGGEATRELGKLMALLPPAQRTAVVLRHVVDLPVAEIAEVMRLPVGTVKSHVSRGLRHLRDLYPGGGPAGAVALPESAPITVRRLG